MSQPPFAAIVLAAGQGTRMHSSLPKVLHPCAGMPMVAHVVSLAQQAGCNPIVVVVSPQNQVQVRAVLAEMFAQAPILYATQAEALGTGDAVRTGLGVLADEVKEAVILSGDVPLLTVKTLHHLAKAARDVPLALLTAEVQDPTGYGRLVRDARGAPQRVVEHKDASEGERAIREINAGIYWGTTALLREGVGRLSSKNAQKELYLTDVVATAVEQGGVHAVLVEDADEIRGVNNKVELSEVESILRARLVRKHQLNGVTFFDARNVIITPRVVLEQDVSIGPGVQLWGTTTVKKGARIDGPSVLINAFVGEGSHVKSFSHLEEARLGREVIVGPYARLRPEAHLDDRVRVGNFVEIKKSHLSQGAKANHLAYIGDTEVGAGANVGAGTITCNYDGLNKHRTHIGANSFIGSNSTLVAPVKVGQDAFVAAGSVITEDVPDHALGLGRARQVVKESYAKALKQRFLAEKSQNK